MYEENSFLAEVETALHERRYDELLWFMNSNIIDVIEKMNNLKAHIEAKNSSNDAEMNEYTSRMFYVFSIFINLWHCRN